MTAGVPACGSDRSGTVPKIRQVRTGIGTWI